MEGPTPVSSLIHAATMVTAGIFLIIRVSYLYLHVQSILLLIILIGSITIFISSTIAINQIDIKKMIAYSTCSQLGYMFMSCGFFAFSNSIFHLLMHAFFKALLFLTSGYIIHLFSNNQDIRLFQNITKITPFGYINLGIGTFSIIGTPFLTGFFSKETIIEFVTLSNYLFQNYYLVLNIVLVFSYYTVQITSMYSLKGLVSIFYYRYTGFKGTLKQLTYPYIYSIAPLFILSIFSIIIGYIMSDRMIGIQTDF
jgi:NADH:ubiquinone oxidoreductase subunit 5 (subunit L)/multisubunit Na+/H+ antiporter MnhA subunit